MRKPSFAFFFFQQSGLCGKLTSFTLKFSRFTRMEWKGKRETDGENERKKKEKHTEGVADGHITEGGGVRITGSTNLVVMEFLCDLIGILGVLNVHGVGRHGGALHAVSTLLFVDGGQLGGI